MECQVLKCNCESAMQDALYGKGMRLFNPAGKGQDGREFRCTICGKTISTGGVAKKK